MRPLFDDTDGADANSNARFEITRVEADGRPQSAKELKATPGARTPRLLELHRRPLG
ncbi:hypothetical protein LLE65_19570 [Xanthomonas campestris]|uniref:hypothetical protein n=1 Tax=Xanthomonas sp. LMC-A-07 TaxID=3040329 RepID=UPI00137A1D66|nr:MULTISPECIES: hypothetical protein [Xanthomonas]MCC5086688.1 hypothetical protein [Xanthomonas campestris]MEB2185245.1 hypothetical protein [Xanthomonas campestris pv. campestris]